MALKMRISPMGVSVLLGPLFIILVGLACATSEPTATTTAMTSSMSSIEWVEHTSQTASYRIKLRTGPGLTQEMMLMESAAAMTAVDQGSLPRHPSPFLHVQCAACHDGGFCPTVSQDCGQEVHIFDKKSGTKVKNLVPAVRITHSATGDSRELPADLHPSGEIPYVTACLLTNHRVKEPHFGDNLYLSNGEYSVTVSVGDETALFEISL